jgi:DNA-binding beta-propeller fold protein YncE
MERDLETAAPSLGQTMTRRRMLGVTGGAFAAMLLAGCGPGESGGAGTTTSATQTVGATIQRPADVRGVVFNTGSQDVTLFDPGSNQVTGSRPTNAVVRWLSNEQHYWDGESIWTYDFPEDEVRAIAIDPESFEITRAVPVDGGAPGHSFVLTPDSKRGFVNAAGSDFLAVVDPKAGEVTGRIKTGAYP